MLTCASGSCPVLTWRCTAATACHISCVDLQAALHPGGCGDMGAVSCAHPVSCEHAQLTACSFLHRADRGMLCSFVCQAGRLRLTRCGIRSGSP